MAFFATIVALVWYREWIDFGILRARTKSSFVVVSDRGQKTAFSLDEKQTRELLNVIGHRTRSTLLRKSVIYSNWVEVFCKDGRGSCLQGIWVHHFFGAESEDVLEELFRIARRGVPEGLDSRDALKGNTSLVERVY